MTPSDGLLPKERILAYLEGCPLDEEIGGQIESYCEQYRVGVDERPIFERFLASSQVDNRSAALLALVECGHFDGYEGDAVLLHYQSREDDADPAEYAAINYLRMLAERGSHQARRILTLLNRDPYVRKMYGDEP